MTNPSASWPDAADLLGGDLSRLPRDQRSPAARMVQLRLWQHLVNELLKEKAFKVPVHLAFGAEAVVTAVDESMAVEDQLVLTHRNAAYNMARSDSLEGLLDEYRSLPAGVCGGVLGSMNLAVPGSGIAYSSSILGNNFSVACGLAFAKVLKDEAGAVWVVTGDGAVEEGGFYEAIVFARSHGLQVVFVIDNNDHSMVSSIRERRCEIRFDRICEAVGVPYRAFESNDVIAYVEGLRGVRRDLDGGTGPVCVEFCTALLNQHAGPTPGWPTDPLCISLAAGLLVGLPPRDPVAVLRETIGGESFGRIESTLASRVVARGSHGTNHG
jgi:TPP-dependent pyruvate/acetoin dehydrogenase alpha subunit